MAPREEHPQNPYPTPGQSAGEWSQYALLILSELQRLSRDFGGMQDDVREILRRQDLSDRDQKEIRGDFERLRKSIEKQVAEFRAEVIERFDDKDTGLNPRVEQLENESLVTDTSRKTRLMLVGIAFTILTAIVLPTLTLISNHNG